MASLLWKENGRSLLKVTSHTWCSSESGGKSSKPLMFSSVVTGDSVKCADLRLISCVCSKHQGCGQFLPYADRSKSEGRGGRAYRDVVAPSLLLKKISLFPVLWPLNFYCHYINSSLIWAIFFLRNELLKLSNLIIGRLSSYTDLIEEIKMCFLFVSILNCHLLKNVGIISHWKV